jgi:error-prone DNA polymerase
LLDLIHDSSPWSSSTIASTGYLARRNHEEEVSYIHPDLQPVLERTLGVPLFQEQMLRIAMIMADFDGGEAEDLRRAISFHRSDDRMKKVVARLRGNMTRKQVAPEVQEKIVNALGSFALYGFPESHAISFALLAYASCYLKVHHALEFYCALLNNQPMGFYSPATLLKDGRRRGVKFRPVCVVRSGVACQIEEDSSIRLGLNYVQGLHRDKAELLVMERTRQPFETLSDLLRRVPMNKAEQRVLAKIGALNLFSDHRRSALWAVEALFDEEDLLKKGAMDDDTPLVPMNPLERLQADYDGTRVTTGPHPMSFIRSQLIHVIRAADLTKRKHGQKVIIAGVVICRQRPGTGKGHVFISIEDETGIANAIVRSELFEKQRLTITHEPLLEIHGQLQHLEGVVSVLARDVRGLNGPAVIEGQSYDFH